MTMSGRTLSRLVASICLTIAFCGSAWAQADNSFSPYSIFGVGDMAHQGSAYNQSMAGVGVALRSNRFINIVNPASVTARDSLAFMADYSMYGDNKVFSQGGVKSVNNVFNINDLVLSFPLWDHSAMMVGITPYSSTGFSSSFSYPDGNIGTISFSADGSGSLYKGFAAAGVTLFKRLSLGAEFDCYFGSVTKTYNTSISDKSYNSIQNSTTLQASALGGKFGLQYEQPIGQKVTLALGATYSTGADLKGYYTDERYSVGSVSADTLYYKSDTLGLTRKAKIASELAVGVSFKYADKLMVAFDYSRSDWANTGIENISGFSKTSSPFETCLSESYRLGMEFVPNRNDIRYYFNRVAYRAGAYYKKDYFTCNGQQINSMGLTFGVTLPVFRWYNGLTLGFELGQRGALREQLVRERYFNFSIGVNIFDIWFQKPRYE